MNQHQYIATKNLTLLFSFFFLQLEESKMPALIEQSQTEKTEGEYFSEKQMLSFKKFNLGIYSF